MCLVNLPAFPLQTRTFPCPLVFSYMHPGAIDPRCCLCGNVASLNHILWGCPEDSPPPTSFAHPHRGTMGGPSLQQRHRHPDTGPETSGRSHREAQPGSLRGLASLTLTLRLIKLLLTHSLPLIATYFID
uniref:Putative tick transposon n=1 Tax=Rhipicephalus microplus TaxID=6941 RepID=A0A6G5AHU4_RHIMP